MQMQEAQPTTAVAEREIVLALWCNSTLGMPLHANHSSQAQEGRGQDNRGMLETMATLELRSLEAWQLDEAQPFYKCALDPARKELDERIVRDLLGLGDDAVTIVARLRTLLAGDPSIHGSKKPELPS